MSVRKLLFDISFSGNATQLLKTNQAVDEFKIKTEKFGKAADQAFGKASKGFGNLGKEATTAGRAAGDAFGENTNGATRLLQKMGDVGKRAYGKITNGAKEAILKTEKFSNRMDKLSKKFDNVSKKTGRLGNALTLGVTMPVAIAGKKFLSSGYDFEAGMSAVKAISGATENEINQLSKAARKMGATTKFSAVEASEALKYMSMAGWDTPKMLQGLPAVIDLAAASGEDLGAVSDILTDAMTAFKLPADQAGHFADVLAQASSKSNTNVALMGDTFKHVAPVAGALGYTIEDVGTAIGLMASSGVKGATAGTALRAALSNFADNNKEVQKALNQVGISFTDAQGNIKPLMTLMEELRGNFAGFSEAQRTQYATAIFGREAMAGMLSIIEASDTEFDKLAKSMYHADGAAQKMAKEMNNNLKGRFIELKSALSEIGIQVYELLLPSLLKGISHVKKLVEKFGSLNDNTKMTILKMIGLAATLGPLLKLFSLGAKGAGLFAKGAGLGAKGIGALMKGLPKLGKGIGGITKLIPALGKGIASFKGLGFIGTLKGLGGGIVALGGSILPVIAIIGSLVAAGYLLWKNWDTVKAKGAAFIDRLKTKFMSFLPTIKGLWENLKTIFIALLPVFQCIISTVGTYLGGFLHIVMDVIGAAAKILKGLTDFLIGVFTGDWERAWEGIKGIFTGIWEGIKGIFTGVLNTIIGGINNVITAANKMKVPDWVPGIGGKGINIPLIPTFAKGVQNFSGGLAIVGEEGPELLNLPRGSSVIPNRKTEHMSKNIMNGAPPQESISLQQVQKNTVKFEGIKGMMRILFSIRSRMEQSFQIKGIEKSGDFNFSKYKLPQQDGERYKSDHVAFFLEVNKLAQEFMHRWRETVQMRTETSPAAPHKATFAFSPHIEIHSTSNDPQKTAETTKYELRKLFDEWVDEALLVT